MMLSAWMRLWDLMIWILNSEQYQKTALDADEDAFRLDEIMAAAELDQDRGAAS